MVEPTLDTLAGRLARLERSTRRWKLLGGLSLVALCGLMVMGQRSPGGVPKIVEAENFVIRDGTGKIRGIFGTDATTGRA